MRDLTVKDIVKCTEGTLLNGKESTTCEKFSKDTRTITKGDIYIGIKGENFDGNLFWRDALDKGADGIIVQDIDFKEEEIKKYKDKTIIKVKDTLKALYKIASYKRKLFDGTVIAITGSVGKTSTKDIVANTVSQKFITLKTKGNNNNNIGLPFTILNSPKETEVMVLEMGMNHFGEISLLSKIAKPNICIITNIGTSHIGNLGSRENILKAKLEILEGSDNPHIIINNDNDLLHKWYEENKGKYNIKTYGIQNQSDIMAKDIELKEESSNFEISLNNKEEKITVPVGGEHFILNSLCAISVGVILDIKTEEIKRGIESFKLTKNRMEITELKNGIKIINDAYNSSLESVKAALEYMNNIKANRRIAVLGDVLETGEFAKELHKKIGEAVEKNDVDILICSGENSKYIVEKARDTNINEKNSDKKIIYYLEKKEDIIDLLKHILEPEDVVLFKASNGMKFFEIAEEVERWGYAKM